MRFAFTEEQEALRAAARSFLADHSSPEQVRAAMDTERGWDPAVWRRIGAELGWPAIIIPEAHGGVGLGYVELIALMEEMGRALLCAPFFSSVCLGANALLVGGSDGQQAAHLPGIATGETIFDEQYVRMLGYEPGELSHQHSTFFDELLHPDDVEKLEKKIVTLEKRLNHLSRKAA